MTALIPAMDNKAIAADNNDEDLDKDETAVSLTGVSVLLLASFLSVSSREIFTEDASSEFLHVVWESSKSTEDFWTPPASAKHSKIELPFCERYQSYVLRHPVSSEPQNIEVDLSSAAFNENDSPSWQISGTQHFPKLSPNLPEGSGEAVF